MSASTWRWSSGLVAWAAALIATLSIANVPGHWGHGICGPWGCGPPLQALVACHSAWIVLLLPPTLWMRWRYSMGLCRQVGWLVLGIALAGIVGLGLCEALASLSHADTWRRPYLVQRIGFVLITLVDVPLTQFVAVGVALLVSSRQRGATNFLPLTSSASPEPPADPSSPAL